MRVHLALTQNVALGLRWHVRFRRRRRGASEERRSCQGRVGGIHRTEIPDKTVCTTVRVSQRTVGQLANIRSSRFGPRVVCGRHRCDNHLAYLARSLDVEGGAVFPQSFVKQALVVHISGHLPTKAKQSTFTGNCCGIGLRQFPSRLHAGRDVQALLHCEGLVVENPIPRTSRLHGI